MAELTKTVTPQDYQGFLAMLNHEGSATILNSLKKGDTNDAMGQIASLTDVWLNRAAARGTTPLEEMNRRNQISYWNPSEISGKANSLDPRIRGMFDAYLQYRANADQGVNPDASFYLNRNYMLQNPGEGQSWHKWFDNGSVRDAYGDPAANGQHLFVASTDYKVPSNFKVSLGGGLTLNPTEDAAQTFASYQNAKTLYPNTVGHVPVDGPPARPNDGSDGISPRPRDPTLLDDFSDAITRGLEGVGRGIRDTFNPPSNTPDYVGFDATDAPAAWSGNDMLNPPLTGPAPGNYDFGRGLNFAGNTGLGLFGSGVSPLAPTDYSFAGGFNPSQGVGPGAVGQLPAGFDPAAYLAQNRDVAASGMDAATHWRNFGAAEGRALAPPGWTQTQGPSAVTPTFGPSGTPTIGSGSTASTIGAPAASDSLPPFFSPVDYLAANGDLQALGFTPERAAQHFQEFGRHEVRALAPWLQASIYDAPGATATQGPGGLSPTYQPPQPTQTFGPGGSVDVMSAGLVPTQGPPGLTPTQGPGPTITARTGTFNPDEYLRANADVAASGQSALDHFRNYGAREGRAIDTLGNHFNGQAYLAANGDVAMAGLNPLEHFLRYGAQEARTLAPTDWASPLTATTDVGTYGAPAATQTIGPGGLTPTQAPPDLSPTFGPTGLTPTYSPPVTTPTFGPGPTMPSWSPFGGAGIGNAYNFSGANVGGGLGATSQSFGSIWPVGSGGGEAAPADTGVASIGPFDFSSASVGGFDVNAAPPADSGGQGGGGGGGGGTAKGSSSSAAFLADQARTRAYWDSLVKPADLYGNTNTHTTPVITPVVPNLTTSNLALGAPGAMFSMFAPWR